MDGKDKIQRELNFTVGRADIEYCPREGWFVLGRFIGRTLRWALLTIKMENTAAEIAAEKANGI